MRGSQTGDNGGQCAAYVRNFFGHPQSTHGISLAHQFWNDSASHGRTVRLSGPLPGSIAVWDRHAINGYAGHVGVVQTVNGDNIRFCDSNREGDERVVVDTSITREELEGIFNRPNRTVRFLGYVRYTDGFTR